MTTYSSASFVCPTCDGTEWVRHDPLPGDLREYADSAGSWGAKSRCPDCEGGRIPVPTTEWKDDWDFGSEHYPWHPGSPPDDHPWETRARPASWARPFGDDMCRDSDGNKLTVYLTGPGSVVEVIDENGCEHAVMIDTLELDLDHVNPDRLAHPAWTPPYPKDSR